MHLRYPDGPDGAYCCSRACLRRCPVNATAVQRIIQTVIQSRVPGVGERIRLGAPELPLTALVTRIRVGHRPADLRITWLVHIPPRGAAG